MEDYASDVDDLYDRIDEDEGDKFGAEEAEEDNSHDNAEGDLERPEPKPKKEKKVTQRPQPKLNLTSLQSPKGLLALNELFKNFKFRGSGHEEDDFANIMRLLEQWAYRLFPKFHFEDTLKRLEALGKKREVHVYLRKIRNGLVTLGDDSEIVRNFDDGDDEMGVETAGDAFDELLAQQIAQSQSSAATPSRNTTASTSYATPTHFGDAAPSQIGLTDEQKARIERNKWLALEKRLQKQRELSQAEFSAPMDIDLTP